MNNQPQVDQPKTGRSLIIGSIVLITLIGGVILVNYIRKINKFSVQKKYNLECFAGCRDDSKCPIIQPYYKYSPKDIENIKKTYNFSDDVFDKMKKKCNAY